MALLYNTDTAIGASTPKTAYGARLQDIIIRIKEDLGVDELLLAIEDSQRIASDKVSQYLGLYKTKVSKAVDAADAAAITKANDVIGALSANYDPRAAVDDAKRRSGKNVEKLVTLAWKNTYELQMEDVNALMPLAQQIVSKYMSNFNVRPKMS